MGELLITTIKAANPPHLLDIQGAGLFWSLVIEMKPPKVTPRRLVALCIQRGVLVSITGNDRVRMCPPLVITKEELLKGAGIIVQCLRDLEGMGELPGETGSVRV
jgi:acetylornithine/succinyldiaminopimelate/putrescine aminotransferase